MRSSRSGRLLRLMTSMRTGPFQFRHLPSIVFRSPIIRAPLRKIPRERDSARRYAAAVPTWTGVRRAIAARATRLLVGLDEVEALYNDQFTYGHREILLTYLGLPNDTVFTGYLPHGGLLDGWPPGGPGLKRDPYGREMTQWLWNERWRDKALAAGAKRVFSIGAPWLYLLHNEGLAPAWDVNAHARFTNGTGIVFFASHSTEDALVPLPVFAREGRVLKERFPGDPLTVCLYWLDYLRPEVVECFRDQGFEVVCNGVRSLYVQESQAGNRSNFLSHQLGLLMDSSIVVCGELSHALMYAASLGKHVHVLADQNPLSRSLPSLSRFSWLETSEPVDPRGHLDQIAEEMGASSFLEPKELAAIMSWANLDELRG